MVHQRHTSEAVCVSFRCASTHGTRHSFSLLEYAAAAAAAALVSLVANRASLSHPTINNTGPGLLHGGGGRDKAQGARGVGADNRGHHPPAVLACEVDSFLVRRCKTESSLRATCEESICCARFFLLVKCVSPIVSEPSSAYCVLGMDVRPGSPRTRTSLLVCAMFFLLRILSRENAFSRTGCSFSSLALKEISRSPTDARNELPTPCLFLSWDVKNQL